MDKLNIIRAELERRKGDIRRISEETGLSYDTVLRIKNGEGDPGFTKVAILAEHLGVKFFCNESEPREADRRLTERRDQESDFGEFGEPRDGDRRLCSRRTGDKVDA